MFTLAIDTSTERGFVAIVKGSECTELLFEELFPFGLQHARYLIPAIELGLKNTGLSLKDFSAIAVGVGPGSYTGIRVGVTVAKTLSFACHCPLIGVCSLEGFIPQTNGPFGVLVDARMRGAYLLKGSRDGGNIVWSSERIVSALDHLLPHLREVHTIITPNAARLKPCLHALYPDANWVWEEVYPSALQMAYSVLKQLHRKEFSPAKELDILYT